jgi:hypothetical protein
MFTITWNEERAEAASPAEVEARLHALEVAFRNGDPTLVTVERMDTGDSLAIGLGLDVSVLNYVSGTLDPPYFTSSGGPDDDGAVSFSFGGESSEFRLRNTIPVVLAYRAMLRFCNDGSRSGEVTWEQD